MSCIICGSEDDNWAGYCYDCHMRLEEECRMLEEEIRRRKEEERKKDEDE